MSSAGTLFLICSDDRYAFAGCIWPLNSLKRDNFHFKYIVYFCPVMCDFSSARVSQIRRNMLSSQGQSVRADRQKSAPRQSSSVCYALHPIFRLCFSSSLFSITYLLFILPSSPKCKCCKAERSVWSSVIGCTGWRCSQSIMPRRSLTNSFCVPHTLLLYHKSPTPLPSAPLTQSALFLWSFSSSFPLLAFYSFCAAPAVHVWQNHLFQSSLRKERNYKWDLF